jgi:hypothetical protein
MTQNTIAIGKLSTTNIAPQSNRKRASAPL